MKKKIGNHIGSLTLAFWIIAACPAQAESICMRELTPEDAWEFASNFVSHMKIAKSHGDLFGMRSAYEAYYLDFAQNCDNNDGIAPLGNEFRTYCNTDCHLQLAEYHLFLANNIEYYFSKATDSAYQVDLLDPTKMQEHVDSGIRVVKSALKLLSGDLSQLGSTESQAEENAYRQYLYHGATFELLKTKLHMAMGDIWYKNLSDYRIEHLFQLKDEAIVESDDESNGEEPVDQLKEARASYRAGLFGINEAMLAIPDSFSGLRYQAEVLLGQLLRRSDSLKQGKLFLNIDPGEYKLINITELTHKLDEMRGKVEDLEHRIDSTIRSFLSLQQQNQVNQIGNQQQLDQASLSLNAYRIAKKESIAELQKAKLSSKLDEVSKEQRKFQRTKLLAETKFMLRQNFRELELRLGNLNAKKEIDVLTFQQDQVAQRINDLRWLMNWETSKTNLELQIMSIDAQIMMLDKEKYKFVKQMEQIVKKKDQIGHRITIAENNQDLAENQKRQLELEKAKIEIKTGQLLASEICEIEYRMHSLGGASAVYHPYTWKTISESGAISNHECERPASDEGDGLEFLKKKCEMRDALVDARIESISDLLFCVMGVLPTSQGGVLPQAIWRDLNTTMAEAGVYAGIEDFVDNRCPTIQNGLGDDFEPAWSLSNKIFAKKMEIADKRINTAQEIIQDLQDSLEYLDEQLEIQLTQNFLSAVGKLTTMKGELSAKESIIEGLSCSVDKVAAGQFTGTITVDRMVERTQMSMDNTRAIQERIITMLQYGLSQAEAMFRFMQHKESMHNEIDKIKLQVEELNLDKEFQALAIAEAVMEMTKDGLNLTGQLQSQLMNRSIEQYQCNIDETNINWEIDQLRMRKEALIASVLMEGTNAALLEEEISKQDLIWSNEQSNIDLYHSQDEELVLEQEKVQAEIDAIEGEDGLKQRYTDQMGLLIALKDKVSGLSSEQDKQQSVLKTLQDDVFSKSIALTEQEIDKVKGMVDNNTSHTESMVGLLQDIASQEELAGDITSQMLKNYEELQTSLQIDRKQMLNTAEGVVKDVEANRQQEVFLSNQELVSLMTNGVGNFISSKQRLIERSNYLLMLLKNRFVAAHSTIDANAAFGLASADSEVTFVRTAADISTAVSNLENDVIDEQTILESEVIKITIPGSSGLMRQIQTGGKAIFEISPIGEGQVNRFGHFVLWHPVLGETEGFTVLDIMLVASFESNEHCMSRKVDFRHLGMGYKFVEDSKFGGFPVAHVSEERLHKPVAYSEDHEPKMHEFESFWQKTFSLFGFMRGSIRPDYDPEAMLPLLGVPVIGFYEIDVPANYAFGSQDQELGCSWNNASLDLVIAFSKAH